MRTRLLIIAAGVITAVITASAETAFAGDRGTGTGYVDPFGNPTVEAGDPGSPDSSVPGNDGSDGDDGDDCWWEVVVADDTVKKVFVFGGGRVYSETGRWLMKVCESIGPVMVDGMPVVPEGGRVIPGDLAQQAVRSVSIDAPVIGTSPGSGRLVVQVPTWLWIDGGWWRPYSATANAGRVSATVTATPVRAIWSTGDGATIECDAGTAWQPGRAEDESSCTHVYGRASSGVGYTMSVTVEFELGWSSNVGESGVLPVISRTGSQVVQVGEIQAIGTR